MSGPRMRWVDENGTPVSHEAINMGDYSQGMTLPGQGYVVVMLKNGDKLATTFRCETYEEFMKFGKILFNEIKRENDREKAT